MSDFQAIKEEVRARTDIVEIVGMYTTLKKAGKDWVGLCPFHADKRVGSFRVNQLTQSYRCWSCGAKGDIFEVIQKQMNMDFLEALEYLAKRAGIAFERDKGNPQQISERKQGRDLNRLALDYFQHCLARSSEARDYVVRRKLLKSTQERWDIGYAPADWEGLTYFLQRKHADMALAAKIGLVKNREQGGMFDTYRNRLMFPIHDLNGDVIGFGGRTLDTNKDIPKYINSSASLLFDKSKILYGLYFARERLRSTVPPVFVEGYLDVVTSHQAGFTQCIATLGTAMTEDHALMLSKYSSRVLLCYDADGPGLNAAMKGATVWENLGINDAEVRLVSLPDGDDPDSILKDRENGAALFQAALDNAVPRVDFEIALALKRHDIRTEQGRADALAEVIPILASVHQSTLRDRYAQKHAYLSPMHNYDLGRAINSILADVETYETQKKRAESPRDRGYPLTQGLNGGALQEQPPPPTYQRPGPNQWGKIENRTDGRTDGRGEQDRKRESGNAQWPNTREVIRRGDGNQGGGSGSGNYTGSGSGNFNGRGWGRKRNGPIGDPTPPSLERPALSGVEKAERQLLRALFTAEWRVYILSNVTAELFVTRHGNRLYEIIARTPAGLDGSIDPLPILRIAQNADSGEISTSQVPGGEGNHLVPAVNRVQEASFQAPLEDNSEQELEEDPLKDDLVSDPLEHDPLEHDPLEQDPLADDAGYDPQAYLEDNWHDFARGGKIKQEEEAPTVNRQASRERGGAVNDTHAHPEPEFFQFIQEILEDSTFIASNDRLNEAVVKDCITRLRRHRDEREVRAQSASLHDLDRLSPEEQRAAMNQLLEKMRALRGSPPGKEAT